MTYLEENQTLNLERKINMENQVKVFESAEFGSVRTVEVNGEPYFVGKDVAIILGYTKPQNAIATHVDEDDALKQGILTTQGIQEMVVINESGLYSLILGSKLPNTKKFKRWVTSEVLPSIRKHGMYATDELLANPDFAIKVFQELKAEREKRSLLETTVKVQSQQIAELQPKASYYDIVLNCKDLVSISVIAKDFGKTAIWLNQYLHDKGIQYKQGGKNGIWLLYQKYAEQGYTGTKTNPYNGADGLQHTRVHTYWTQKGRLFIYDMLKTDGILPKVEQ